MNGRRTRLQLGPIFVWSLLLSLGKQSLANDSVEKCGLYLAYSEAFGSMGVFTANKLEAGSLLDAQDIVIPLIEDEGPIWNDHDDWSQLLGYVEWEGRPVRALVSGTGGSVNLHDKLYNVEPFLATDPGGLDGVHRATDVGAGAFAKQLMMYRVSVTIPAGGQLLVKNIGASDESSDDDQLTMDTAVDTLNEFFSSVPQARREELVGEAFSLLKSSLPERVPKTFPNTLAQYRSAKRKRVENTWTMDDIKVSPSWLRQNGACLDNVVHNRSTERQAGRGGFATRTIEKGSVVAPIPVVPVSRFNLEKNEDDEHQLLRNYCFGHSNSSLLLCPYGSPASYVNHAPDERTNAKLTWSTRFDSKHEVLANQTVDEILKNPQVSLIFDLVAIKDIKEGEEIFLDYGDHWYEEWLTHVESWKAPEDAEGYESAQELNVKYTDAQIRTEKEQDVEPYPSNVFLAVRYYIDRSAKPVSMTEEDGVTILMYSWSSPSEDVTGLTRPVYVLSRKRNLFSTSAFYTLELENHPLMPNWDPQWIQPSEKILLTDVPRSALHFIDAPYTSDHHLEAAFRSEMRIPDEIFPEAWMDVEYYWDNADWEDQLEDEL